MKKLSFVAILLINFTFIFAQEYKITKVEYNLNSCSWPFLGTTKEYALKNNVEVNQNIFFSNIEELEVYIKDYKQRLSNTRAFDKIEVTYTVTQTQELNEVTLFVTTKDTVHLLAVPYPKYNSNDGFVFKLKAKDTNFFGTMNPMSTDINFTLDNTQEELAYSLGFNFSFDFPFEAGIFDATWVNDYSISYTVGNEEVEWDAKTGFKFELPKNDYSYVLEIYQNATNSLDYIEYNDSLYFNEYFSFSLPIKLYESRLFGKLKTIPSISFSYNWDMDGINEENTSLSSPYISIGNTIDASRMNWNNNFRTGLAFSLDTTIGINLQRELNYPSISFNFKGMKEVTITEKINFLNRFGICSNFYIFNYFTKRDNPFASTDGESIGSYLRGIKDTQYFNNKPELGESTTVPTAIILNLDFPYHIFSTNFTKTFLKHFNFDLQISPFIDFALTYNKATNKYFALKDGFYAGGLEVLIYPKKWSSFVVRASLGVDIGSKFFSEHLNIQWRDVVSRKEISIGIGLHY